MGFRSFVGKALGHIAPSISIGHKKINILPYAPITNTASAAVQGKPIGDTFKDQYGANLRGAAIDAAAYGGAEALGAAGAGEIGGAGGAAAGAGEAATAAGEGGSMGWLKKLLGGISGGDVLSAVGSGVGGYMDAKQSAADRAERQREFDAAMAQREAQFGRTQGDAEGQLAVQAQTALNKAPMADKAQALLLSRMSSAPTSFQPRDWTHGVNQIEGTASGGPQDQIAAGQKTAAAYTPGAGGVNAATLRDYLAKMQNSAGLHATQPAQPAQPAPAAPVVPSAAAPPENDALTMLMAKLGVRR